MPKSLVFILLLTLIFALLAPNFAFKAALAMALAPNLSQGQNDPATPSPASPEDAIKKPVQDLMNQAQNELQQGFDRASKSAQEAAKAEFDREIALQTQNAKKGIFGLIQDTVIVIEETTTKIVNNIISWTIKTLHLDLFRPKLE